MIDVKKYMTITLHLEKKAFVVHIIYLKTKIWIYLAYAAKNSLLIAKKLLFWLNTQI